MDPVQNRQATPRRRGRPSAEEIAARPPPTPAQTDPATGRTRCPYCGKPTLAVADHPRKADGAQPHRCTSCGYRCARLVLLAPL
jgi:DNA-directed RNA polymerase subunit RPC12/RpoP